MGINYNWADDAEWMFVVNMAGRLRQISGNVVYLPGFEPDFGSDTLEEQDLQGLQLQSPLARLHPVGGIDELDIVLCGTFRKDIEGLQRSFEQLKDLGFNVLSPSNLDIVKETNGFVYMRGEESQTADRLELRHLEAIERARLVWLHAPEGYVGPTAALELGFARASGIPVFATSAPLDEAFRSFVTIVDSPQEVFVHVTSKRLPPPPPRLKVFQHYYRQAAAKRGYEAESTQNCLLLMMEEVGELARALRKKQRLTRHGSAIRNAESLELADVFMYVIHMANILNIDLGEAVQEKELINIEKLLRQP